MLNIEDVYERIERNPEPKEIEEIRKHILSSYHPHQRLRKLIKGIDMY